MTEVVREKFAGRPYLIADSDIPETARAFGYPTEVWDETTQRKLAAGYRHGAFEAAELLLSRPAVEIQFVDANDPGTPLGSSETMPTKRPQVTLGFNDHGGGSESGYKILLNMLRGRDAGQYVLVSPPQADSTRSNTTFYRGDFTFPSQAPFGDARQGRPVFHDGVPNPLKTYGAASNLGQDGYKYYLVGQRNYGCTLVAAFRAAGFRFVQRPMDFDTEYMETMGIYPSKSQIYTDKAWPNGEMGTKRPVGQFAEQISRLRLVEAMLSAA